MHPGLRESGYGDHWCGRLHGRFIRIGAPWRKLGSPEVFLPYLVPQTFGLPQPIGASPANKIQPLPDSLVSGSSPDDLRGRLP